MAAKIGKREKLIVGFIIGIAAIGAVHFFVFQSRQAEFDKLKSDRDSAQKEMEQYSSGKVLTPSTIDAYTSQTARDEQILWKAVLGMDLIVPVYFGTDKEPEEPAEKEKKDKAKMEQYSKDLAAYNKRTQPMQVVADEVLLTRFERLINMKKAYEGGQPWKGDNPTPGDPGTNVMKMPFLGAGVPDESGTPQNGWNLPLTLPKEISTGANLWDEVNRLYSLWQVLSLLSPTSENATQSEDAYIGQLKKMGLDKDLFPSIVEINEFLPEYVKALHARMIWKQRKPGENVMVGTHELTMDMLNQMYDVRMPRFYEGDVMNLNRQLEVLERILPIARRDRIEEIQGVNLPKSHPVAYYPETKVVEAKTSGTVESTPTPRALLASGITGNTNNNFNSTPVPVAKRVPNVSPESVVGLASAVTIRLVATNENAFRFLYDLINDPFYYRIDSLSVYAGQNQKIIVDVTVDNTIGIISFSVPGKSDLVDAKGKPLTPTGKKLMATWEAEDKKNPFSMQPVVQAALAQAGLPPDALEKMGPAPPSKPKASPTTAGAPAGGMGGPGGPMGGPGGAMGGPGGLPGGPVDMSKMSK